MLAPLRLARAARTPAPGCLRDRVVLVTGAGGGLGRATALAAAQAGANVVLLGRKVRVLERLYDELEAHGGPTPAIYPLDLEGATPRDYEALADTLEREFGRLDGIAHCAAHFNTLQPFGQIEPLEWARTQHVNVTAPLWLTQACLPLLEKAADAAVVFVLDDPQRMGRAYWGAYGVAKQALATLVSILHEETENSSLRVHGLLPMPMRTALRRAAWYGEDTAALPDPGEAAATLTWLLGAEGASARGQLLDLR